MKNFAWLSSHEKTRFLQETWFFRFEEDNDGGDGGVRTRDHMTASHVRSQLRYIPTQILIIL